MLLTQKIVTVEPFFLVIDLGDESQTFAYFLDLVELDQELRRLFQKEKGENQADE